MLECSELYVFALNLPYTWATVIQVSQLRFVWWRCIFTVFTFYLSDFTSWIFFILLIFTCWIKGQSQLVMFGLLWVLIKPLCALSSFVVLIKMICCRWRWESLWSPEAAAPICVSISGDWQKWLPQVGVFLLVGRWGDGESSVFP